MKFPGKMRLMTILKIPKKYDFTLTLQDKFLEKPQRVPN